MMCSSAGSQQGHPVSLFLPQPGSDLTNAGAFPDGMPYLLGQANISLTMRTSTGDLSMPD